MTLDYQLAYISPHLSGQGPISVHYPVHIHQPQTLFPSTSFSLIRAKLELSQAVEADNSKFNLPTPRIITYACAKHHPAWGAKKKRHDNKDLKRGVNGLCNIPPISIPQLRTIVEGGEFSS